MAEQPRTRDIWDKIPIISGLLAAVAVPIAIAVVGNWYTQANKEQELKLSQQAKEQELKLSQQATEQQLKLSQQAANKEWVQIGIDILRDPNVAPSIRKWGIQIVSRYGGIQIDEEVKDALTEGAVLPQSSVQQAALPPDAAMASTTGRVAAIDQLQEKGRSALLAKDLDGASAAYDEAYLIWPTFRNVDEIRRVIHEAAKQAQGPNWQQLYRAVATMDLRGISPEVQDRLHSAAGG